jgi:polyferredoxin
MEKSERNKISLIAAIIALVPFFLMAALYVIYQPPSTADMSYVIIESYVFAALAIIYAAFSTVFFKMFSPYINQQIEGLI